MDEDTGRTVAPEESSRDDRESLFLTGLRSALGGMNALICVLLAAMLLPLIIGPFVVAYEFVRAGGYGLAGVVVCIFAMCVALAARGVRRGEMGVGTFAVALLWAAFILYMASRLPR